MRRHRQGVACSAERISSIRWVEAVAGCASTLTRKQRNTRAAPRDGPKPCAWIRSAPTGCCEYLAPSSSLPPGEGDDAAGALCGECPGQRVVSLVREVVSSVQPRLVSVGWQRCVVATELSAPASSRPPSPPSLLGGPERQRSAAGCASLSPSYRLKLQSPPLRRWAATGCVGGCPPARARAPARSPVGLAGSASSPRSGLE
jgi:hypothetical protein